MEALHAYSILYRRCTPSALSLVVRFALVYSENFYQTIEIDCCSWQSYSFKCTQYTFCIV